MARDRGPNKTVIFFLACVLLAVIQLSNLYDFEFSKRGNDCESILLEARWNNLPTLKSSIDPETMLSKMSLTNSSVVYFVLSRRYGGLEQRNAIRETWAKGKDNVYFVIGQDCRIHPKFRGKDEGGNEACEVSNQVIQLQEYSDLNKEHHLNVHVTDVEIEKEMETNGDLLITDVVDVYRTLPQKIKVAYTFIDKHLPRVEWIVKVDDDFFVQVDIFSKYLNSRFDSKQSILVGGRIMDEQKSHLEGKWKEVPQFPEGGLYPPFPLGSYGYAVSRPVASWLAQNQEILFNYQGEDVSIGIWLELKKDVKIKSASEVMSNDGLCTDVSKLVIGHDIGQNKMRTCFDQANYTSNSMYDTTESFSQGNLIHSFLGKILSWF